MILVVLAALCLVSVPLTGGHLSALAALRLRWAWLGFAAIGIQLVITVFATGGSHSLHEALHVISYVPAGVFLWVNRRVPGAWLIAMGFGLNAMVIVLNHGLMPASATAQRLAGLHLSGGFQNSTHLAHAHLAWLGDIIPFPLAPFRNVLSPGDCLLYLGMLLLLHRVCRRPAGAQAATPEPVVAAELAGTAVRSAPVAPLPPLWPVPAPRPVRAASHARTLTPLGMGLAGLMLALGIQSLVSSRNH